MLAIFNNQILAEANTQPEIEALTNVLDDYAVNPSAPNEDIIYALEMANLSYSVDTELGIIAYDEQGQEIVGGRPATIRR